MSINASEMTAGRPFFSRLESIRGLGAVVIAGYHFSGIDLHGRSLLPHVRWADVGAGWRDAGLMQYALGRLSLALLPAHAFLMLFFVISGFVLRQALEYGPRTVGSASAKFFIARAFRVYPIVGFLVMLTILMKLAESPPSFPSPGRLVAHLLLLDVTMNGTLWALQVELLMAPVIVALFFLERRWGPGVLVGVGVTATGLAFVRSWAVWPPLSANLFAFVLGMAIPTHGRRFALALSRRGATLWAVGAGAVLLASGSCFGLYSRWSAVFETYAALVAISIVAYRLDVPVLKWLDNSWLRRLGSASGSYYVLHMATIPAGMAVASALLPAGWSVAAPAAVGVGFLAVWLLALVPLMMSVSRLVEMPGIALGRRLIRALRLDARPQGRPDQTMANARRAA
jgi:peptidoglycan/LPS O-acetylase OafA/YrhL